MRPSVGTYREVVRRLLDGEDAPHVSHELDVSLGFVNRTELALRTAFDRDLLDFTDNPASRPGYPRPGDVLELNVVDEGQHGDGVAYLENGLVVFVSGTEPPMTVTARVTVVEERYAVARPVSPVNEDGTGLAGPLSE